jgi:ABC-type transport system substrate-binding protein
MSKQCWLLTRAGGANLDPPLPEVVYYTLAKSDATRIAALISGEIDLVYWIRLRARPYKN